MDGLARDRVEEWLPPDNAACSAGMTKFGGTPSWERDGQSYSCSYCGSMSTEELLECLDAAPQVVIEQSDKPWKFYVHRYPHAGECSENCLCDTKRGGGPIKFYAEHLADGGRGNQEIDTIWLRCREASARYRRMLLEQFARRSEGWT